MKSPLLFLVFLATAMIALGSNTLRDWKTNSGKIYTADLVSYDVQDCIIGGAGLPHFSDFRIIEFVHLVQWDSQH